MVAKRFEAIDPSKILSVSNPKVFPKNDFLLVPIKTGYPREQNRSILLSNIKFCSRVLGKKRLNRSKFALIKSHVFQASPS